MESTDMNDVALHDHPVGVWTEAMKNTLRDRYGSSRELGQLRTLADELGVGLYQLYSMAHKLGLSREIRRR
jgi:hypothetical protein